MYRRSHRCVAVVVAVVVLFLGLGPAVRAQEKPVLLRWKVPAGGPLGFKTDMSAVDPSKEKGFKFDVDGLFDKLLKEGAAGGELKKEIPDMKGFSEIKLPEQTSMTTILRKLPGGNISVKMIMGKVVMPKEDDGEAKEGPGEMMREMMKTMEGTVQLRAEIDDAGEITSFYLQQRQKNLVAMFFELPKKPVRPADTWSIDVNFIEMGAGFICEKAQRTNRVKLVSLTKTPDGDTLATLDYCVAESVKGKFKVPMMGEAKSSAMSIAFLGRGEFLVNKGTWKRLTGRMKLTSTGLMAMSTHQNMAMEPMKAVPGKMLELE